jgi:hypothetical protein
MKVSVGVSFTIVESVFKTFSIRSFLLQSNNDVLSFSNKCLAAVLQKKAFLELRQTLGSRCQKVGFSQQKNNLFHFRVQFFLQQNFLFDFLHVSVQEWSISAVLSSLFKI